MGDDFVAWVREHGLWAKWATPLSPAQIDGIEHRLDLKLPPDYVRFLMTLHGIEMQWNASVLYNWLSEEKAIVDMMSWPTEGIVFDVEHNALWHDSWGERPDTAAERSAIVQGLATRAPRLIPLSSHRFLVAQPCEADNIVLSVYQSDIIPWAATLRDFLISVFTCKSPDNRAAYQAWSEAAPIPFWGDLTS